MNNFLFFCSCKHLSEALFCKVIIVKVWPLSVVKDAPGFIGTYLQEEHSPVTHDCIHMASSSLLLREAGLYSALVSYRETAQGNGQARGNRLATKPEAQLWGLDPKLLIDIGILVLLRAAAAEGSRGHGRKMQLETKKICGAEGFLPQIHLLTESWGCFWRKNTAGTHVTLWVEEIRKNNH